MSFRSIHDNLVELGVLRSVSELRKQWSFDFSRDGARAVGAHGWSDARSRGALYLARTGESPNRSDRNLSRLFRHLNEHHFGGTLPPVPVAWGLPADHQSDDLLAICHVRGAWGVDPVLISIYVTESFLPLSATESGSGWRPVARSLLHEMVHLAVSLDSIGNLTGRFDDHGWKFADECNRIGILMGWDEALPANDPMDDDRDARWWPSGEGCEACAAAGSSCQTLNPPASSGTTLGS